ncbi:hypothetical protein CSUI_005518 [Cystoisospora suis]|uniref:Transmembrane protein n=1 Tax=Cystoisospora suis TaxID=483139 RepID=A0A2C6KXM5_9APIC|nr:hypothetical protein CSUI_005518 [Cystoisospora suis]
MTPMSLKYGCDSLSLLSSAFLLFFLTFFSPVFSLFLLHTPHTLVFVGCGRFSLKEWSL